MSFYSEFIDNLFMFIRDTTSLSQQNVIASPSDGLDPVGDYVAVDVSTPDQLGSHYTTTLARDEQLMTTVTYQFTTRIFFVGNNSADMIVEFNNSLNNVVVLENLQRLNISLLSKSRIQKVPIVRETKQTKRYYIDCVFLSASHSDQDVYVIDQVTYTDFLGREITVP